MTAMNVILSPIAVPDLINQIAAEIELRLINREQSVQPQPASQRLYGDKSAADYLGCSVLTIQKLRKTGEISFYRYGRKYYYISSELDAALKVDQRKFGKLPKSTSQTR